MADDKAAILKTAYKFDEKRSAMLFADFVILAEGQTERTMIPELAKKIGCYNPDVEIVDCGGHTAINSFQTILQGFGIRYVAWMERDEHKLSLGKSNQKSLDSLQSVKDDMSPELGRMVILRDDWECLAGVPEGEKPYNSWKYFKEDGNSINDLCKEKIVAAYNWQDHKTFTPATSLSSIPNNGEDNAQTNSNI